jgi:hypothetical protein
MVTDFYVYVIFSRKGIPCYIGKGRGKRFKRHARYAHNPRLRAEYKRAGGNLPSLKIREDLTEESAFEIEKAFIAAIGRGKHGPLFNFTDGGEGSSGRPATKRMREAMRRTSLGRKKSPEELENLRLRMLGKKHSPEVLKKISRGNKGKRISESHCTAISRAHRDKPLSAEHRAKIGNFFRGRKQTPEQIDRRIWATNRTKEIKRETANLRLFLELG